MGPSRRSPRRGTALTFLDQSDALARCVRCGLCLPHCPTFRISGDEAESPRGRIVLAQGLLDGMVAADASFVAHMDGCLHCGACESVCPAGVPFTGIMDAVRGEVPAATWPSRALRWSIRHPRLLALASRFGRIIGRLQGGTPGTGGGALRRALRLTRLLGHPARPRGSAPAPGGRVALFTGCLDPHLHASAVTDAAWVIRALGYQLVVPPTQVCCGGLHQHAGDAAVATELRAANDAVFAAAAVDAVVFLSSGCGMTLMHGDDELAAKCREICSWVDEVLAHEDRHLAPVPGPVALHRPCTARNMLPDPGGVARMLGRLPGLRVLEVDAAAGCCGAAGSYMIDQGERADRLGALAAAALPGGAEPITSNLGCALQLAIHSGRAQALRHPISLLRAALEDGGSID